MRTLLSMALLLGLTSTASADRFDRFASGGLVLGGSIHDEASNGFLLGGELSGGALFGIGSKGGEGRSRAFGELGALVELPVVPSLKW